MQLSLFLKLFLLLCFKICFKGAVISQKPEFIHCQNEHLHNLHAKFNLDVELFNWQIENNSNESVTNDFQQVYLELLEHQRKLLNQMNHKAEFDEDLIRKYLALIDLEEFKIREKRIQDPEAG